MMFPSPAACYRKDIAIMIQSGIQNAVTRVTQCQLVTNANPRAQRHGVSGTDGNIVPSQAMARFAESPESRIQAG
jgi:hypothetical protein